MESNTPNVATPPPPVARPPTTRRPKRRREPVDPPPPGPFACPYCGERHQGVPLGGGGLGDAYGRQLVPEPGQSRPTPIAHQPAHVAALQRDWHNPWRASPAAEPRPPTALTLRERVAHLWFGDALD